MPRRSQVRAGQCHDFTLSGWFHWQIEISMERPVRRIAVHTDQRTMPHPFSSGLLGGEAVPLKICGNALTQAIDRHPEWIIVRGWQRQWVWLTDRDEYMLGSHHGRDIKLTEDFKQGAAPRPIK